MRLEINRRIEELRKSIPLTQPEFAKRLSEFSGRNYTRSDVNNWEAGGYNVKADTILNIAKCFDVSTDYLLGKSDVPSVTAEMAAAAKYTGLSEETVSMLRSLAPSSYEGSNEYSAFMRKCLFDVLNYCLSDPDFYFLVLGPAGDVLELLKKSETPVTTGSLSAEELSLLTSVIEKGFYVKSPDEAIDLAISRTADATSRYWTMAKLMKELPEKNKEMKDATKLFLEIYGMEEK